MGHPRYFIRENQKNMKLSTHLTEGSKLQNVQGSVCHTALYSPSCSEALNRNVLNVDAAFPEYTQVFFMGWEDGRILATCLLIQ